MELVTTAAYAGARIDTAIDLADPAAAHPGRDGGRAIDQPRAAAIASRTRSLTDADAAYADEVLAAAAPGRRRDQLAARPRRWK